MSDLTLPQPPVGPAPQLTTVLAPDGFCLYRQYVWDAPNNRWGPSPFLALQWDYEPYGYVYLLPTGNQPPSLIVIIARTDPKGILQPNQLVPLPIMGDAPQCPPGFQGDPNNPDQCIISQVGVGQTCPPGFKYDPSTERCVPICPPGTFFDPTTETCIPIVGGGGGGGGGGQSGQCPPGTIFNPVTRNCDPAPPPAQCPPGFTWNPSTEQCEPNQIPITPCYPNLTQPGDELTENFNCLIQNILYLQQQLQELIGGQQGGQNNPDPLTCKQVTGIAIAVNTQLAAIFTAITKLGAQPPPVVTVDVPVTVNVPQQQPPTVDVVVPPPDLQAIVDQLVKIVDQGDVDKEIIQALVGQGLLTNADLQTLTGIKWSDAIAYLINSTPVRSVMKLLTTAGTDLDTLASWLQRALAPAGNWAENKIAGAAVTERNAIQDAIEPIIRSVTGSLRPAGPTQLGNIGVNPDTVLANVVSVGLNLYVMTALVGLLFPGAAERLAEIAELATGVLGFEELKEVQIGPLVQEGIGKIASFAAKATFRQELPSTSTLQGLVAQGLMDPLRARFLSAFNGTSDELYPIQAASAYRGLNARQMLRLIETNLFSGAEIADELTFSGMRAVSQHRMILAAPYLATASERSSLRATIETAAVAGLLSDADVSREVDGAETNTDRDTLVLSKVHLQQLIAEAKDLELEYVTLYLAGIDDDATLRANLAGIGLQQWKINTVAAKAEARAEATLQRQAVREAEAQVRLTKTKARAAAVKNFTTGNIDAAGLLAALLLTGLTAVQAAAWVDLAVLQKGGSLRWLYGLQVTPQSAILLRQRVTALTDQRKRLQITDAAYVQALQALGIGPSYINAMRAAADSMISPKTSAVVVTVQTG